MHFFLEKKKHKTLTAGTPTVKYTKILLLTGTTNNNSSTTIIPERRYEHISTVDKIVNGGI